MIPTRTHAGNVFLLVEFTFSFGQKLTYMRIFPLEREESVSQDLHFVTILRTFSHKFHQQLLRI